MPSPEWLQSSLGVTSYEGVGFMDAMITPGDG
jgi:hypothetical protein